MRWEHCSGEQMTWTELDSLRHLWVLQPLHPPSLESRVGSAPRSLPASPASLASPCQQTSLRQRAGLWYPAMLQRLHDRQGCAWPGRGLWGTGSSAEEGAVTLGM